MIPLLRWRFRPWLNSVVLLRSAEIADAPKVVQPAGFDVLGAGLNDSHDIAEKPLRDAGLVVAEVALARGSQPDLRGIGVGLFGNVDVNGFQRVIFVGPEINGVWPDLKDLRH